MKHGEFVQDGKLESAIINPKGFVKCIEQHFNAYLRELRARKENDAQVRCKAAVVLKWPPVELERYVGMTEEEFRSGSYPLAQAQRQR